MRNQPHSQWQVIDAAAERREDAWSLDKQVELRTWLLGGLAVVVVVVIAVRLGDLKVNHPPDYLANAHPVTTRTEPIPAVDGRIYSSDGQLLAYDHQHFNVAVHYRWLEEPPNPLWLKEQARKQQRKRVDSDPLSLDEAKELALKSRDALWQRLRKTGSLTAEEFETRRAEIQERIERIAEAVDRRQQERLAEEEQEHQQRFELRSLRSWSQIWELVKSELTEPPARDRDPIVIKEELDFHTLIEDVPTAVVAEIEAHPTDFPGVRVSPSTTRIYPRGSLASHVIGLRSNVREDQIRERKAELPDIDPLAYSAGDRQGRFGVERSYNSTLRGLPGAQETRIGRQGDVLEVKPLRTGRSGNHLILSLHSQLQSLAESLLDEVVSPEPSLIPPLPKGDEKPEDMEPQGGCILVMNVFSGEIVAAASAPRPDLVQLAEGSADYWKQMNDDRRGPLLSRITQVLLAPGSTFKPVTAIALCESEGVPRTLFNCRGFLDTPKSHRCAIFQSAGVGHGDIGLIEAISSSCNVYFFDAARRLGPATLESWSHRLGFGRATGVDLPFEQSGHVPTPKDNGPNGKYEWYSGDTLGLAIGQSYLTVTPMQMLAMTAAVANGGELIVPRVVSRIVVGEPEADGVAEDIVPPVKTRNLNIDPETLGVIRAGLEQTVSGANGTGHRTVYSSRVAIAGKTGSAQTGLNRPPHAWFAGYAPADQPRYAFVVMIEYGGGGGETAGPLARKMVEGLLDLGLLDSGNAPLASGE